MKTTITVAVVAEADGQRGAFALLDAPPVRVCQFRAGSDYTVAKRRKAAETLNP